MSTPSHAMPDSFPAHTVVPVQLSQAQLLYWSVRRELWEYRALYLAPLGVGCVFLVGFLMSLIRLPSRMEALSALDPMKQHKAIALHYDIAAGLMMVTAMIVGAFYCLDALYGERRDRSILFWKSLPVSDAITVLSKACIPLLVLPLLTFTITVGLQWTMLLLSTLVLLGKGASVGLLWTQLSFVHMSFLLLYHLFTVHAIWPAPLYAWLLLISAWARRAPFLWATLPVVVIAFLEKTVFNTSHFVRMLMNRMSGSGMEAITTPGTFPMDPVTHITFGRYLLSPGLWIGLAFTAAFLVAAVRLRRNREPI
jgi:ABC-2 type transport system permease protein